MIMDVNIRRTTYAQFPSSVTACSGSATIRANKAMRKLMAIGLLNQRALSSPTNECGLDLTCRR